MLEKIIAAKKRELEVLKEAMPFADLKKKVKDLPEGRDFRSAVSSGDCSIIAEVKRHSPSKGSLKEEIDPVKVAALYERNGAVAISVLTDREFFHGSWLDLAVARAAVRIPVLRKDFVIDPYQLYEAKLMNADAVLLISGLLTEETLQEYIEIALSLSIWPLVEVHTHSDLETALAAGAELIGINNRDLKTFQTDLRTTLELLPSVPEGKIVVTESGINTRDDVEALMKAGVHAFLIGEALITAPDPGGMLRMLSGRAKMP